MDQKIRCQSCGMPLGTPGYYGTNEDNSENKLYCMFCFKNGQFTNPTQTLLEMIQSSVKHMTESLKTPEAEASKLSNSIMPELKRWKKN